MKKTILLFVMVTILAFSAFGASASSLTNYYPNEDSYTITYNVGAENAKSMYGLVVVIPDENGVVDTNNTSNIVYIDQKTADETGKLTFDGFAPMGAAPSDLENFKECTVFIGGPGFETATQIGVLKDGSGVGITGAVIDTVNPSKVATVALLNDSGAEEVTTTTKEDGTFELTVPAGSSYSIKVSKTAYLTFTYTGVNAETPVDLGSIDMSKHAGNINGDSQITIEDLKLLLADYGDPAADLENPETNINGDSQVTIEDLKALLAGYGDGNVVKEFVPAQ